MNSLRTFLLTLALCSAAHAQPQISFSKFLPGGWSDAAEATAIAPDGSIWVAGSTNAKFASPGPNISFQAENAGGTDVYIARYYLLENGGSRLDFFSWLGGDGNDEARGIAVDADGRVHVVGITRSSNFPTKRNPTATALKGTQDAFYTVIDPSQGYDNALYYSTYLGTDGIDEATAIALDANGWAIIVGHTNGAEFPGVAGNAQPVNRGVVNAFLARINPNGEPSLNYATYYGGDNIDVATGVGVAPDGRVWFTGYTSSPNFPVSGIPFQPTIATAYDGFLVLLDLNQPGLSAIQHGTFFGGNSSDIPTSLKISNDGSVWIAGHTSSSNLFTTGNAAQVGYGGGSDGFLTQFVPTESGWTVGYSSYIGGPGYEIIYGLTTLNDGRVAITGYQMYGGLYTTQNATQPYLASMFTDAFITTINPTVAGIEGITFSSYLGGAYNEVATSINSDASNALIITGYSYSFNFPVTDGSNKTSPAGLSSAFITRITQ